MTKCKELPIGYHQERRILWCDNSLSSNRFGEMEDANEGDPKPHWKEKMDILAEASQLGRRRSQDLYVGGGGEWGTWPTPPSLASVVHTFEAVVGSWGSESTERSSRQQAWVEIQSEIKIAKNVGEITFGGGFL